MYSSFYDWTFCAQARHVGNTNDLENEFQVFLILFKYFIKLLLLFI